MKLSSTIKALVPETGALPLLTEMASPSSSINLIVLPLPLLIVSVPISSAKV